MGAIQLLGLDFGSTTSSMVAANAQVLRNCATGRMEFGSPSVFFRSHLVFTPYANSRIDEQAVASQLDGWIRESGVDITNPISGGVIVTGLAAQLENAAAIESIVRPRLSDTLFATAGDPRLESWLAFMGSCLAVSRSRPDKFILNLDIGGGTTNLALGKNGEVIETGCVFAGARHFQFDPGTYRITSLSTYATRLLGDLGIDKSIGMTLGADEVSRVTGFYASLIEAAASGDRTTLDRRPFRYHESVRLARAGSIGNRAELTDQEPSPLITLSGGVGELVYRLIRGQTLPSTTAYGDLGIDFAERIAQSPWLAKDLSTVVPENFGHATVYGLCIHSTELSGNTWYLSATDILPLRDLPIVARLSMTATRDKLRNAIHLAGGGARGGAIEILSDSFDVISVRRLGVDIAAILREGVLPPDRPLVLFLSGNVGKTLGSYAAEWGRLPVRLAVIDELSCRNARFASLSVARDNAIPVSFYGIE